MVSAQRKVVLQNTLANYAGALILAVAPIATLPTYLHSLGDFQWGLVGFAITLQALLAVVDAGVSQVLIREFAVRFGEGEAGKIRAAVLLRSCERLYLRVSLVVIVLTALLSATVADHWLHLEAESIHLGMIAVLGGGVLCACYIVGMLYRGVAMAGQEQVRLNVILGLGAIVRFGGGAVVVAKWPCLQVYLAWHVLTLGLEVFARHLLAWRVVGGALPVKADKGQLRGILGSMSVWTAAAAVGAITTQMDKILLSAMLPIGELASYFVASQLALGMLQIFTPAISAMLPVLLRPASTRWQHAVHQLRLMAALIVLSVIVFCMVWFAAKPIIELWLGSTRADEVVPILTALIAGICFNALANVGYISWLANDQRVRLIGANLGALAVVIVGTQWLVPKFGVQGAAVAWSGAQMFVMFISLGWILNVIRDR